MMRTLSLLTGSMLLLAGCVGNAATTPAPPSQESAPPPASAPTSDYFNPDNPELAKTHKAQVNPAIGEAQVKEAVQAKLKSLTGSSATTEMKIELKDAQWVKDNLDYEQSLFTLDSPMWVVTITGDFAPPDPEVPVRYKSGTFVVDVEFARVISTVLKP